MLLLGEGIGELQLATRQVISPRAIVKGGCLGLLSIPFLAVFVRGLAATRINGWLLLMSFTIVLGVLAVVGLSFLHKLQRGKQPAWLPHAKLHWLVISSHGTRLRVSGLSSALRVLERDLDLVDLEVGLSPRQSGELVTGRKVRWGLRLTPAGGKPLPLWDIRCTSAEAHQIVELIEAKIAWAQERQGQGAAEVPDALRQVSGQLETRQT